MTHTLFFIKTKQTMNTKIKQIVEKLYAHRCELAIALMALVTLALLMLSCHAEGATLAFALVATGTGGEMVTGGPVATDAVHEAGTDYLLNEIDRQITKIRPMATPVDQLSRLAGAKRCGSMVVDYYNVDTKPTKCTLKKAVTLPDDGVYMEEDVRRAISTSNDAVFDISDTILVKGVSGYNADGVTPSNSDLVLYVVGKSDDKGLTVIAVNGMTADGVAGLVPPIAAGTELIRMGRAATELDVQTA